MGFVRAHLAAKADDVGEHDRGQPPLLHRCCLAGVVGHRNYATAVFASIGGNFYFCHV